MMSVYVVDTVWSESHVSSAYKGSVEDAPAVSIHTTPYRQVFAPVNENVMSLQSKRTWWDAESYVTVLPPRVCCAYPFAPEISLVASLKKSSVSLLGAYVFVCKDIFVAFAPSRSTEAPVCLTASR